MGVNRRQHSSAFKAKVALEAAKQQKTIAQLASEFGVHSTMITKWKRRLLQGLPELFSKKHKKKESDTEKLIEELYRQIGQLKVESDWLKKNLSYCVADKRRCIDPNHPHLPISRQCHLLSLSKAAYYYKPRGISEYNLQLMRLIDEEYTRHPFYGSRRLTAWLKQKGNTVNIKRIRRLMQIMGIEAIYQKPHLSGSVKEHKKFPYLLRGVEIKCPDHVWSTDITYIRMKHGFVYLVAIMDWYSRYVLAHEISTTLDTDFCLSALEKALKISKPEIFNTDQGCQFTSKEFTTYLTQNDITISMDGRGRAHDNIFIERLWRSVKYEDVYLKDYQIVSEVISGIDTYFQFYNNERLHMALGYLPPAKKYPKSVIAV